MHNIRLRDGSETFPEARHLTGENPIAHAAKRTLRTVFPDGMIGKSIVDLGCAEGAYAVEFARIGMKSLGIEVRRQHFENCIYVRDNLALGELLDFANDDVTNLDAYGVFDAVFACGILYHLDNPRAYLEAISRHCRKVLLLETHYSQEEVTSAVAHYNLSPLCQNEGLTGRWYSEHGDIPREQLEAAKGASWANTQSFWPLKQHLLQTIREVGFDLVLEQHDRYPDIMGEYYREHSRAMFVGIKT